MKSEIAVIADQDTVDGFRLAGVNNTLIIEDEASAEKIEASEYEGCIVFVTADSKKILGGRVKQIGDKAVLLQQIPTLNDDTLSDLIREAIGFNIGR